VKVPGVRWTIAALLFIGISIQSMDRVILAAAMPSMSKELRLTPDLVGLILAAFFWSYTAGNIPGGILADRLKPRRTFTLVALWWSVSCIITGLAKGFYGLLGARILLGAGEGPDFATAARSIRVWFPKKERGTASAIYSIGVDGGIIIGFPLAAIMVSRFSWREAFVFAALLGFVWALVWWKWYDEPQRHSRVASQELTYIGKGTAGESVSSDAFNAAQTEKPGKNTRWYALFKYRQVWGITLGLFCNPYPFFLSWLPLYLVKTHHVTLMTMGFYAMLTGITGMIGGFVGGIVSDGIMARTGNLNIARKLPICVGWLIGSSLFITVSYVSSAKIAITVLCVTSFCLRLAWGPIWTLPAEIAPSPSYVGTITGIMNTSGSIGAGSITPIVVGVLVATTGSFVPGLYYIGGLGILGAAAFLFVTGGVAPIWHTGRE
jgi:ACS family glucarate transporter-like MFS transporter